MLNGVAVAYMAFDNSFQIIDVSSTKIFSIKVFSPCDLLDAEMIFVLAESVFEGPSSSVSVTGSLPTLSDVDAGADDVNLFVSG